MKDAIVIPDGLSALLFCKGIIKALKKHNSGTEISVISSDGRYKKDIEVLGVKSISVEMYRFLSPLKDFIYFFRLYRIFKREKFDIVINFSTKPNIYGSFAARLTGVKKVISHVVGLGSAFLPSTNARSKLIRFILLALYHIAGRWNDKIWFTNESDLEYFISRGIINNKQAVLSKNYLDIDYYSSSSINDKELVALRAELKLNAQDKVVLMVARMIWSKGIREFSEAAELLKDKYPYFKFLLVAPLEDGNPDAVPESYIREKEKRANLKWLGFRNDVKNIYALSNLVVLPSYYKEGGFPRGLTEAMAMGKPIITTNSVHCRATVEEGKNGYLVPVKDSAALASAIEVLINDNEKSKKFGSYSRLKAEREFNEKIIIEKVIKEII